MSSPALLLRWQTTLLHSFDRLDHLPVWKIFLCVFLVQTALHVRYLNDPPNGYHQWRQVHGYAFARNFYEEDMNIFAPRVDDRGSGDGVGGIEFPLMYFLTAIGYWLFGMHWWVARVVALLFSFATLWYCFQWMRCLFRSQSYALLASGMLLFNPLFVYYSGLLMSDVPQLAGVFMSLFYWEKWRESRKHFDLFFSVFGLFLASLLKIYALFILLYFGYTLWKDRKQYIRATVLLSIATLLVGWWYWYIIRINTASGLPDFPLPPPFPTDPHVLIRITKKVFLQWLPEVYVSYPQFLLLIFGFLGLSTFRKTFPRIAPFLLLFSIGLIGFLGKTFERLEYHDYYFMLGLPVVLILLVSGFQWLRTKVENRESGWTIVFFILLICVPVIGSVRGLSRCETGRKALSPELVNLEKAISPKIERDDLVVVASDPSPCIELYFAHRKGWSVEENVSASDLEDMTTNGAKYLISNSRALEQRPEIARHLIPIKDRGEYRFYFLLW